MDARHHEQSVSSAMQHTPVSDDDVARQILGVFARYQVAAMGVLKRNHFFDIRDGDFQRGLDRAVHNKWVQVHLQDRYRYILTDAGRAAFRGAGNPVSSAR